MQQTGSLYEKVVNVTQVYLGPAAERFINRQIRNHLRKDPEELAQKDLTNLIDWIKIAMGFLTEDHDLIDAYIKDLRSFMKNGSSTNK